MLDIVTTSKFYYSAIVPAYLVPSADKTEWHHLRAYMVSARGRYWKLRSKYARPRKTQHTSNTTSVLLTNGASTNDFQ